MSQEIRRIVATDCGSTTTKAILIEQNPSGNYRLVARGEAPTTVEKPFEDVTMGVINSITERLWPMGEETAFVPGHGPMSTFGHERRTNPYVSDAALAA